MTEEREGALSDESKSSSYRERNINGELYEIGNQDINKSKYRHVKIKYLYMR